MPSVLFRNRLDPSVGSGLTGFFVSPEGSDSNGGSEFDPFLTLDGARAAIQSSLAGMAADVNVYLRGGVYPITETVAFGAADSGQNGHQVIYQAFPGEVPILSGGVLVTGWSDQGSGLWRASCSLNFRQLYVNNIRAIRARTPNVGTYYALESWNTGAETITLQAGTVIDWDRFTQVEAVIIGYGVNHCALRLASRSGATITPQEPERTRIFDQTYPPKVVRPYFFENALEFCDTEGEFYLDTVNDFLYYRPRVGEDMTTVDVYAPQVERLLSVIGTNGTTTAHDIEFHGIWFEHATWLLPDSEGFVGDQASTYFVETLPADEITSYPSGRMACAVYVYDADDILFERCVWQHCGADGLHFYQGVRDSQIIGNVFYDLSGSGCFVDLALLGNTANANIPCRRITIANNYVKLCGQDYYQTVGIGTAYVDEPLVEHNEVTDLPYVGITSGWGWSYESNTMDSLIMRRNKVWNTCKLESDSAGIYTLSDHNGGLIEHNYILDIARVSGLQGGFNISGIYLDEGSGDITVQNNVVDVDDADDEVFQNANGSNVSLSDNDATDPGGVIAGAGLEAEYVDIRSLVP